MYWLIEDIEQLKCFYNSGYKEAFIEIIPYNDLTHPAKNNVSLLYLRPILADKGYIICINHSEGINVNKTGIDAILKKFDVLYCRDKKEILHYFPLKTLYDINIPPTTYIRPSTITHDYYYRKHRDNDELNLIIPIVKHYELCEQIFRDLKDNIKNEKTKYSEFFNNRVSVVFNAIERSGLRIHVPTFKEYFHEVSGEYVHSQYNLKTLTTRPSNKFKGVNYAALNKENGCRKSFIPSNNIFCEIDISAYHPSLSCSLIDYNFPTVDIHSHMAKLYGVSYAKSKELTFKQLYGGVFRQYEHLEYFQKIKQYIRNIWTNFEEGKDVICPVSNYVFNKNNYENMNPQKLFNYILQNLETSTNVMILWEMFSLLKDYNTKLILYTYDSFLFDLDEKETDLLDKIRLIFSKFKLNTKEIKGYDYNFTE